MPIRPKWHLSRVAVESLATRWQEIEREERALADEKQSLKKEILRAIRSHGGLPRSRTMKVLLGVQLELQAIFPSETLVDPAQAREFLRQFRRLGDVLFERCERFTARPGAFEANEHRLDAKARALYRAAVRRRALPPRVKVAKIEKAVAA